MQDEHGGAGRGRGEPGHPAPAPRPPPALQTLRLRSDQARHSSNLLSNITSISKLAVSPQSVQQAARPGCCGLYCCSYRRQTNICISVSPEQGPDLCYDPVNWTLIYTLNSKFFYRLFSRNSPSLQATGVSRNISTK